MKWRLQIKAREKESYRLLLKPAIMPSIGELSMRDWRNYPMPVSVGTARFFPRDASSATTIDGRFAYENQEYIRVGDEVFRDDDAPMETLELAMERWGAFPNWNRMQYDFRMLDEETGEVIPLFAL